MKTNYTRFLVIPSVLLLFLLGACQPVPAAPAQADPDAPMTVVATYSILGDLVANVGGEHVDVITLVGPDGDAHTFEPTPADSVALTQAALIFENGLEFETWLDDLYTAAGAGAERVVVSDGIELRAMEDEHGDEHGDEHEDDEHGDDEHADDDHADDEHGDDEHADDEHADDEHGDEHEDDEHADEHGHHHGEFDPHVWHDVANGVLMVEAIRDALSVADPDNAASYATNADAYLAELTELDGWAMEQIESIPPARRKLVTAHDTFGYFAARYGLEVVGTGLASFSTEAADPSAGEMAELIETIQAEGVPALFAENVSNPALIKRIAQETGATIGEPLYTDALGAADSSGATYIDMVRHNVTSIVTALSE